MTKKVAIVQSNYIPWKGFFDLIAAADEFVLYSMMMLNLPRTIGAIEIKSKRLKACSG
jgi:hypothetical protein